MNCTSNISAPDWFYFRPEVLSDIIANSCWPWTQISASDWTKISSETLANIFICDILNQLVVLIISPIGIISSVCSALSVWRKVTVDKERFYVYMLIIAIFDLIFCLFCIPVALSYGAMFPNVYLYSYIGSAASRIIASAVYSASLAADLCTLILSFERFLAICKPTTFKKEGKTLITVLSVFIVFTVSAVRFLSSALMFKVSESATDGTGQGTYIYVSTEVSMTVWFTCLQFFSDTILPFIMLFAMVYLSLRIAYVIARRRKSRIHDSASVQQQQAVQQQSVAMLRLLAILVFLYVTNQLGWCIYAIESYAVRDVTVSYDSSLEDINYFVNLKYLSWGCALFGGVSECLARSVNFYLYCIFTQSTREDFRRILGLGTSSAEPSWAVRSMSKGR